MSSCRDAQDQYTDYRATKQNPKDREQLAQSIGRFVYRAWVSIGEQAGKRKEIEHDQQWQGERGTFGGVDRAKVIIECLS
jgi:hypothetical protein